MATDPQRDPNSMSVKDILVGIVIPRIEGIEMKLNDRMDVLDTDVADLKSWRSKVNGIGIVAACLPLPVLVGLIVFAINSSL